MFIPILLGTGRDSNSSSQVAKYVLEIAKTYVSFETALYDVKDLHSEVTVPAWTHDEKTKAWSDVMNRADGLIIVSPEYNHSFPGELKIVLDGIFDEYAKKPLAICSVSAGAMGGPNLINQLNHVAIKLGMVPLSKSIMFTGVKDLFNENGQITNEKFEERLNGLFDEVSWYAKALKTAREA